MLTELHDDKNKHSKSAKRYEYLFLLFLCSLNWIHLAFNYLKKNILNIFIKKIFLQNADSMWSIWGSWPELLSHSALVLMGQWQAYSFFFSRRRLMYLSDLGCHVFPSFPPICWQNKSIYTILIFERLIMIWWITITSNDILLNRKWVLLPTLTHSFP